LSELTEQTNDLRERKGAVQERQNAESEHKEAQQTLSRLKQQEREHSSDTIKDLTGQTSRNIIVNICFCLDCTGSMSRWLLAAKEQMRAIIDGITTLIKKDYPSLNLKLCFAIVGYRDINDRPQFFSQNFTDNTTEIITFLNRLTASGGDDIPEDVLGALDQCINLNWSATNARFIVLITDAPGHGPELNDNLAIDKYPQVRRKNKTLVVNILFLGKWKTYGTIYL